MSINAQYASTPKVSSALVSIGDAARITPGVVSTVFTAGASGSRIDNIDFQAIGSTVASAIRLWLYDGTTYRLWREVPMSANTVTGNSMAANSAISSTVNNDYMPLVIPAGTSLRASIHDTQLIQAVKPDSLVAAATLNGNVTLGNATFTVTAAAAANLVASVTPTAGTFLTLLLTTLTAPSVVTITAASNTSAASFTVRGLDVLGAAITETITGPASTTVYGTLPFAAITSIYVAGSAGAPITIGTNSSVAFGATPFPTPITITSAVNATATNFVIRGLSSANAAITETLAGPAAGATVTSVNSYRAVTLISASASTASTSIGTPPLNSGVNVIVRGGDF